MHELSAIVFMHVFLLVYISYVFGINKFKDYLFYKPDFLKIIHIIIYYEYKLGNNAAIATQNIKKVFGENTVNERTV